ncbi:haloacid dehalogenase type II [Burkholderia cenocepacia]|uniref:haloacid dehalogenase type II n=1 Tax=Burkholderia cenocepacia TaxID=95486 RepID=UPI002AB638A8|nr:haloacid dehalogenase type II [Burkholderia cenocepacia]
MSITDFKALSFDCYGTLVDWEAGMRAALKPITDNSARRLGPDEILERHARHAIALEQSTPWKLYRDLLPIVYKRLAEELSVPVKWDDCAAYGRSIGKWPIFSDTIECLQYLKKHYRIVILSNVDNANFSETNRLLGTQFDAVITAEDIGAYKPSHNNFEYMIEHVGSWNIGRHELLHVACSLFHDVKPAQDCGLTTCFINRRHGMQGSGATPHPDSHVQADHSFPSLSAFVDYHKRSLLAVSAQQ